ncbi:MAG: D-inositol-3-phosphate glycosyltransferase [Actinomycetota bacterium]|nr:D-inositol-3-phosphate glycosyltransferase [Actinomycetota bacterium]
MQERIELAGLAPARVQRAAIISVHTCPLDQPGTGDSGGMNVYIRSVARRLAEAGIEVDIFSRAAGRGDPVTQMAPGVRVIHLQAGPEAPVEKEELPQHLCSFLHSLIRFETGEVARLGLDVPAYDVIHSHYWLSGWIGRMASRRWNVPLVHSFHTLGRVKNRALAKGDRPEPPHRIAGEERVIADADVVLAPTVGEAAELVHLYNALPERVRVVAPGVETELFSPGDRAAAKRKLGLDGHPVVLFVARLQPLKSPEIAVDAVATLLRRRPDLHDLRLIMIGGPSGRSGLMPADLEKLAATLGIGEAVRVEPALPQEQLVEYYRAADVVLITSRTESFGLVALEAESCGTPVVASDVGGLRTAVRDGVTGLLVPVDGAGGYAQGLERLLFDDGLRQAMGAAGVRYARRYDWRQAAAGLISVYEDLVEERAEAG